MKRETPFASASAKRIGPSRAAVRLAGWFVLRCGVVTLLAASSSAHAELSGTWQAQDVGSVAAPGSSRVSEGTITVSGSGADIWGAADAFHLYAQTLTGDGTITARITGMTDTNGWAKAGVMIRASLAADAANVFLAATPTWHGIAMQQRSSSGGATDFVPGPSVIVPYWLRLTRRGVAITAATSPDGVAWTEAASFTANFASPVYIGLAVCSHNDGVLCTATFDNVSVLSTAPPSGPPSAPANLAASPMSSSQIALSWTNTSTAQSSVSIERSGDGRTFVEVARVAGTATSHADSGLSPGLTYYYQLRGINSSGVGPASNVVSATTSTTPPPSGAWQSADIGTATAGQTSASGDAVTLKGSGRDIWNETDGFRYYYQPGGTGDVEMIVRVASLQTTHGWAKAGIMIRDSLDPGSPHAWVCISVAHGTAFQYRTTPNGETLSTAPSEDGAPPRWLKLVAKATPPEEPRPGTVTGYVSWDGINWTVAGSLTLGFTNWPRYIGLATTSHSDGTLGTAQFDNVRLITPPPAPTDFRVARRGPDGEIQLVWNSAVADVDSFVIRTNPQRAGNHNWSLAATVPGTARQATIRVGNLSGVEVEFSAYRDFARSPTARTWATPTLTPSLAVAATSDSSITLRVSQSYGNFYGDSGPWSLERSADGASFVEIASGLSATEAVNSTVYVDYTDGSLPVGATRYYRARYLAPNGDTSSYSSVISATTTSSGSPPLAPTHLRLGENAGAQMQLSWSDNATNETSYQVERATDGTNFTLLATLSADAEAFTDTTVAQSTTYSYRVRAVNGAGPSGYSNTLTLKSAPPVPAAPSNLAVSSVSATYVSLTWTDNSPDRTTSFDLQRSTDGLNFERASWSSSGPPFTNATDSSIAPSTTYHYRVRAVNISGASAFSSVVQVTTPAGSAPAAPSGLTAVAISTSQVRLNWTDNATNESGFETQRSTDGVNFTVSNSGLAANLTSVTEIGLNPSTTYYFRVRAMSTFGTSAFSNVAQVTTPAGSWQSSDIGALARVGSDSASGSTVTVSASGADIWHEADSFRFRYQTLNGDGSITARVTSITNTDGWAKAGVMIRSSLLPGARNVFVAVTPAWHGLTAQARPAEGGSTTGVAGPAATAPYWVRLTRVGMTFTAEASSDGTTWSTITTFTVPMDSGTLVGLAVTSHNQSALCTATFDNVTVAGTPAQPPPSNPPPGIWSAGDIGGVGQPGSHTAAGSTITINGSGADVWGTADGFHFVWQARTGDGLVEAQVMSMGNTNGWAKAGVMIRESTSASAPNVFVALTPTWHGMNAQSRSTAGGETTPRAGPPVNAPYWVRLTRTGNSFTAASSANGTTWTNFATVTVPMSATALFGFAVTSHDNAQLNQAVFQDPFVGTR